EDPLARLDALAHQPEATPATVTFPERLVGAPGAPGATAPASTPAAAPAAANTTAAIVPTVPVLPTATAPLPAARPVLVAGAAPAFPASGIRVRDTLNLAG